jgi:hypothetical protein
VFWNFNKLLTSGECPTHGKEMTRMSSLTIAEKMFNRTMATRFQDSRDQVVEILQCVNAVKEMDRVGLWTRLVTEFGLESEKDTITLRGEGSIPDDEWSDAIGEVTPNVREFVGNTNHSSTPEELANRLDTTIAGMEDELEQAAFLYLFLHRGGLTPYVHVTPFIASLEEQNVNGNPDHKYARRVLETPCLTDLQKLYALIGLLSGATDNAEKVSILKTMATSPNFGSGDMGLHSLIENITRVIGLPGPMRGDGGIFGDLFEDDGLEEALRSRFPGMNIRRISFGRGGPQR